MTEKKRAKRRLSNMHFEQEGAHMALVSVQNGGPANGVNTLLMKSATDTSEMNEQQLNSLKEIIKSVEGIGDEEASQYIGNVTDNTNGVDPVSQENNPDEDINMSDVDVQAEVQKALAAKEEEMAQIQKSLQEQLDVYKAKIAEQEKKEEEVRKAQFVEVAKGYKCLGVTDENQEQAVVALMKMAGDESFKPVQDMLEKAKNLVEQIEKGTFNELGHDVESEGHEVSGVMKALQAKKTKDSK